MLRKKISGLFLLALLQNIVVIITVLLCFVAEAAYEDQCQLLLDKKDMMLRKYRQLLMSESQRLEPTANDVMLSRMFLNEERLQLKEDMKLALEDPGQLILAIIMIIYFIFHWLGHLGHVAPTSFNFEPGSNLNLNLVQP